MKYMKDKYDEKLYYNLVLAKIGSYIKIKFKVKITYIL